MIIKISNNLAVFRSLQSMMQFNNNLTLLFTLKEPVLHIIATPEEESCPLLYLIS